jgi:hypothetical protein
MYTCEHVIYYMSFMYIHTYICILEWMRALPTSEVCIDVCI